MYVVSLNILFVTNVITFSMHRLGLTASHIKVKGFVDTSALTKISTTAVLSATSPSAFIYMFKKQLPFTP